MANPGVRVVQAALEMGLQVLVGLVVPAVPVRPERVGPAGETTAPVVLLVVRVLRMVANPGPGLAEVAWLVSPALLAAPPKVNLAVVPGPVANRDPCHPWTVRLRFPRWDHPVPLEVQEAGHRASR